MDNVFVERLWRSVKDEGVDLSECLLKESAAFHIRFLKYWPVNPDHRYPTNPLLPHII